MRLAWVRVSVACLAVAACKAPPASPPPFLPGWTRVSDAPTKTMVCGELPVLVDISHAHVNLTGRCGYVRIVGEHLDVVVDVVAGGTIEMAGAHDDVFWRQVLPGAPPHLLNNGGSNTFHAPRAP